MQFGSNPRLQGLFPALVWWERRKVRNAGGRLGEPREAALLPDTELLIDGFQGSANSFFLFAFRAMQPRLVHIAHHLHAATAVREAARRGLPAVVTIRDPAGAVRSTVKRWPYISVAQALRHYVRYYEAVEPVAGTVVLSPFAATTRRPDLVVEAVNARFGTAFTATRMTSDEMRAVRPNPTPEVQAAEVRAEAEKRLEWERQEDRRRLQVAEAVYHRVLAHAPPALSTPPV